MYKLAILYLTCDGLILTYKTSNSCHIKQYNTFAKNLVETLLNEATARLIQNTWGSCVKRPRN